MIPIVVIAVLVVILLVWAAEFELLRTIGMAIDCPMPSALETQTVA